MANARIGQRASGAGGALALALAAAASTAAPSPAAAQPGAAACPPAGAERRIEFGSCRRSTVDSSDPRTEEGTPYEEWRLRLGRGQAVQIDMDAAPAAGAGDGEMADFTFDTYLELRRAGAPAGDTVASNDDRPGSLDARIRYTSAQGGDYIVRARPLGGEQGGDYVLRVGAPPPPPPVAALSPGRVSGSIDARAPESEAMSGYRSRHYAFQGSAGERVRIALASPAEGATVQLGGTAEEIMASATAEAGSPATLVAILPETRRYTLLVHAPVAADSPAAVPFTLDFERRAAVPPSPPRPISTGATASGELGLASPDAPDPYGTGGGRILVESYRLAVEAGRPVTVTVTATGFDPVLEAGDITVLGFAAALSNDDYGDGLNSRLVLHPERSGTVVLRVRALGTGGGPFQIAVAPGAAPPIEGHDQGGHDEH
jgi:hypothetical protein